MNDLISVIIPAFNSAQYLPAAIESVLQQEHDNIEIIVVDDGSTDDTERTISPYPIRYYYQENQGSASARNQGITMATGSLIAFLDADDVWVSNKLQKQISVLQTPEVDVVSGLLQITNMELEPIAKPMFMIALPTLLIKKHVFEQIGDFDTQFTMGEDVDWLFRAFEANVTIDILPEVLAYYRRHDSNVTNQRNIANKFFLKAIKRSLNRRRNANKEPVTLPRIPEIAKTSFIERKTKSETTD